MTKLISILIFAVILGGAYSASRAQDIVTPSNTDSVRPTPEPTSVTPAKTVSEDYFISPDDELEIFVLDVAELSRTYRVSPTGMISVPLLTKPIKAAGNSPAQLSQIIADQLREAGMVSHPQVTVQVKNSRLHSIAIAGSVKKPQIYSILGKTTLMDALSQAEGLTDDAGNTAIITRGDISSRLLGLDTAKESEPTDPLANPRTIVVDLKRLMEGGDPKLNYDLYPGDRVTVQRAGIVYVEGAVNRAGGFVLKEDREQMTVLKALALAQYVTSTADTKKAVIIRGSATGPGGTQEIPIELDKMLKRRAKDRVLLANDILLIPDSASKRAVHRAGEAAAQAAALMVYRY
ncbi:MAG TPA: polysaccharide biosynthesis/export family protein [Terriglobia bacterium]|nr:polysaccharide biosynthesis/export family protein [Terriglobia bacterium]